MNTLAINKFILGDGSDFWLSFKEQYKHVIGHDLELGSGQYTFLKTINLIFSGNFMNILCLNLLISIVQSNYGRV